LLAIIANERGAKDAVAYDEIVYLGFPFSVSEIFQQRNTNSSIAVSLGRVEEIQNLCNPVILISVRWWCKICRWYPITFEGSPEPSILKPE
jgi:hypothetical protein